MSRRRVADAVFVIGVAALACVWALTLRPQSLGGDTAYVMVRGISMQPTYHTGDLVILKARSSYRPGDVAAYRVPDGEPGAGRLVIHRIVRGNARDGFVLLGDNNEHVDPWLPKQQDMVGTPVVLVPKAGLLLSVLRTPLPLASLSAGIALAMFLVPGKKRRPQAAAPALWETRKPVAVEPTRERAPAMT